MIRMPRPRIWVLDTLSFSCSNLVAELKIAGIPFEYGAAKLKQGFGEAVVYALQALADKAIKSKGIVFQKPIHKLDEYEAFYNLKISSVTQKKLKSMMKLK